MNSLSLRVSNDSKKRPRKSVKEDLGSIINQIGHKLDDESSNKLLAAKTAENQISELKNLLGALDLNDTKNSDAIEFFTSLYLILKPKSPLKIPLGKLLGNSSNIQLINQTLVCLLKNKLTNNGNYENLIEDVAAIGCCLENSNFSVDDCNNEILNFLQDSIKCCHSELKNSLPPTKKLLIINCIHHCTRCCIILVQKENIKPNESFLDLNKKILIDSDLPLDIRSNLGLLHVLLCQILHDSCLEKLSEELKINDETTKLCIISGILNTFSVKQLVGTKLDPCELLIIITSIQDRNAADCNIVLSSSRCINLLTKSLIGFPNNLSTHMLEKLLSFIWIHLEHFMDAVRHLAFSSLSNLVSVASKCNNSTILDQIRNEVKNQPAEKRSKHAGLLALVGKIKIKVLLNDSPTLVNELFISANNSPSVNHVISTLESLIKQHFKEVDDIEEWYSLWVDPLVKTFGSEVNPAIEHMITNLIKCHPDVITYVSKFDEDYIHIQLICAKVGRKFGFLKNENDTKWNGIFNWQDLETFLYHSDDNIRLASFALIIESQKTTEVFSDKEFGLVKLFLQYNINNQCPAVIQKGLALFKKFFSRFKESLQNCKNKNKLDHVKVYEQFLNWLINFSISNLFPGANLARRCTSLNILNLIKISGFWSENFHTKSNIETLLTCMLDSYEDNKELAKCLLVEFNDWNQLNSFINVNNFLKSCLKLASSVSPTDSISAAYFFKFVISFEQIGNECEGVKRSSVYFVLNLVLEKLKQELSTAKINLLKAASSGPMYGLLLVIRHILLEIDLSTIENDNSWQFLIQDILLTAFDCDKSVAFVVNNSSPEGILPMDVGFPNNFECLPDSSKVTSQMVLLCSWRTVKEVSLLLGELVERSNIKYEGKNGLLNEKQVLDIGEHLTNLLTETKHRGAFEQAYIGFCKLASRLWRHPEGTLHELPQKWLNDTLIEIKNDSISATRRSAGIPFIIQALVCSEVDLGSEKLFKNCIITLLQLARDGSLETRVHALNILRALYRHSLLGETVTPFIADGVDVAINGFNSKIWAERNSSTLLLGALMVRIFGVPRTSLENINWKNKMTGRIFFQRFPSLYNILLFHLKQASKFSNYPAIYPVLLILARLYPSSLEGTDSNLQLNKYIPYVSECTKSSIYKTRTLAASAMVALITPNIFVSHINEIINKLFPYQDQNILHGLLYQVLKLLNNMPTCCIESFEKNINLWLSEILYKIFNNTTCFTVKECAAKIFINIIFKFDSISNDILLDFYNAAEYFLNNITELPGNYLFYTHLAIFQLGYCYLNQNFSNTLIKLLKHDCYEVRGVALDFFNSLLSGNNLVIFEDLSDVNDIILNNHNLNQELKIQLCNSEIKILISNMWQKLHHEDMIKVLMAAKYIPCHLKDVENYLSSTEEIGALAFQCYTNYLNMEYELEAIVDILLEYSTCEMPYKCRKAGVEFLINNFESLSSISKGMNILKLWSGVLNFLTDDELDIRKNIIEILDIKTNWVKSLEIFFERIRILEVSPVIKFVFLIIWAMGDYTIESKDAVFHKGDMNDFKEDILICKGCCEEMRYILTFMPNICSEKLSKNLILWLKNNNFNLNEENEIIDIFHCFKNSVLELSKTDDLSPFRSIEIKVSVQEFKLNCISNALNLL